MPTLTDIAKQILEDPFFIGAPNLQDKLDWESADGIQAKNLDYLILKRSADEDPDVRSQLASIAVVGRISEERCKLMPCGGWTDTFGGALSDAKASFVLVQPRHQDLLPLWDSTVAAINTLQDSKRSHGAQRQNEILVDLENSIGKGLKFRHKLFEEVNQQATGEASAGAVDGNPTSENELDSPATGSASDFTLPAHWDLTTWPCVSAAAKNNLRAMLDNNTHEPIPFLAYDVDKAFIRPQDWVTKLHGAEVLVKFNVTHQWFGRVSAPGTKKDNYYAEIAEIHVLRPPRPPPTSPRKRPFREHPTASAASQSTKAPKKARKNCALYLSYSIDDY